ncbi:MAG: hypothetical protein ACM33T_08370 [Solirubrobacterales bacterium]
MTRTLAAALAALLLAPMMLVGTPAMATDTSLPEPVPSHWQDQAELFGRLAYIPPARNGEVIAWERANADRLSPGFLFDLSRRLLGENPNEALEWYALAMMRGLYDSSRCIDSTARRAVSGLARQAEAVARWGRNHPQDFAAAGKRALGRQPLFDTVVEPDWVCAQGLTGMGGRTAGTTPPSTWPASAEAIRADFTRQFDEMAQR